MIESPRHIVLSRKCVSLAGNSDWYAQTRLRLPERKIAKGLQGRAEPLRTGSTAQSCSVAFIARGNAAGLSRTCIATHASSTELAALMHAAAMQKKRNARIDLQNLRNNPASIAIHRAYKHTNGKWLKVNVLSRLLPKCAGPSRQTGKINLDACNARFPDAFIFTGRRPFWILTGATATPWKLWSQFSITCWIVKSRHNGAGC
jgi:hypothetical protein